jgi:hypothetical protein
MPTTTRPARRSRVSLDRRAIGVAAHLLVGGVWLEQHVGNTPKLIARLLQETRLVPPPMRTSHIGSSTGGLPDGKRTLTLVTAPSVLAPQSGRLTTGLPKKGGRTHEHAPDAPARI